jgi:DNA-binding LacI/PurR family transcriptional regulator/signal transduction histidine kinase
MDRGSKSSQRFTIGILADSLFDAFEDEIWRGAGRAAKALDVNLLTFPGGPIRDLTYGQFIYDLVTSEVVDGIVSFSACVGLELDDPQLASFLKRFAPLPIVSLGRTVRGAVSNVLVDNETGVRELVSHLIQIHGRRRIAYVRGPAGHAEADARYRGYREALALNGVPLDPQLVYQGSFDRRTAPLAVAALVDERKVEFDALIAANDYNAIYAIQELQLRGFTVPEQVAVGGFDDIRNASSIRPALSTVRQPMFRMGWETIARIVAVLRGEAVPKEVVLPTEMVIRRSCGCDATLRGERARDRRGTAPARRTPLRRAALTRHLEGGFPELTRRMGSAAWADDLSAALLGELGGKPKVAFLAVLERLIEQSIELRLEASEWHRVLEGLFEAARGGRTPGARRRWTALRDRARLVTSTLAEQLQSAARNRFEEEYVILQRAVYLTNLGEEEIRKAMLAELPRLGIPSLYFCFFTDPAREQARLFLHFEYDDHVVLDSDAESKVFPSRQLVPGRFGDVRFNYVVLPINAEAVSIGFAVCEEGPIGGPAYQTLAYQVGRVMRASSLLAEVSRYAGALEARVDERTRQLEEAQQQLLEAAHQAGMAEVAVGVMHNIGNLLNSVTVSAEGIARVAKDSKTPALVKANELFRAHQDDLPAFFAGDPKARLLPEYYAKVTDSLDGDRARIQEEAEALLEKTSLIRETIRTLQEYARGGRDVLLREEVDVVSVIEAVLKIQATNLDRHRVKVRRELQPLPQIEASRTKLVHILLNLIKNAVEAMRSAPEEDRSLSVKAWPGPDGGVSIEVSDTGEGIPPECLGRIFSHGFTTKKDGNGFGLHTCANYMAQMGGRISVASEGRGRGAVFTVVLCKEPPPEQPQS